MGNYLKVTFSFSDGTMNGEKVSGILATVELYSDSAYQNKVAEDTTVLDFRYDIKCKTDKTAVVN